VSISHQLCFVVLTLSAPGSVSASVMLVASNFWTKLVFFEIQ